MIRVDLSATVAGDEQLATFCKNALGNEKSSIVLPGGWPTSTGQLTNLLVSESNDGDTVSLLSAEGKLYDVKRIEEINLDLINRSKGHVRLMTAKDDSNSLIALLLSDFEEIFCHVDFIQSSASEPKRLGSFRVSNFTDNRIVYKIVEVSFARDSSPILIEAKYYSPDFGLLWGQYIQFRKASAKFDVAFHERIFELFRNNPAPILHLLNRGDVVIEYRNEALVAPPAICEVILLDEYDKPFTRLNLPQDHMLGVLSGTPHVPVNDPDYVRQSIDLQASDIDNRDLPLFRNLGTNPAEQIKSISLPSGTVVKVSHRGGGTINHLLENLNERELLALENASEREIVPIIVRR